MKNIKINDTVIVLKDTDFICPVEHVKKDTIGSVVDIIKKGDSTGYVVEINYEIYVFEEDEIEVIHSHIDTKLFS